MTELLTYTATYVGVIERAERTPSIVTADKIDRALGTTLAALFTELEQGSSSSSGPDG